MYGNAQSFKTARKEIPGIINIIPSPTKSVSDIAHDGKYLWIAGFGDFKLFQVSPEDGKVIKTIPIDVQKPYGLTFDGKALWLIDNEKHQLIHIDTSDGSKIASVKIPGDPLFSYPQGLAWDGKSLWHNDGGGEDCDDKGDQTFQYSTGGGILRTEKAVSPCPSGLAYDGQYLYSSDNFNYLIYKIDPKKFKVVKTMIAPGGRFPNGLAHDGTTLWVANSESDSLYQLDSTYQDPGAKPLVPALIYPNPSENEFHFQINVNISRSNYKLHIYNSCGQYIECIDIKEREFVLELWKYADGLYIFMLSDENGIVESGKFLKS